MNKEKNSLLSLKKMTKEDKESQKNVINKKFFLFK